MATLDLVLLVLRLWIGLVMVLHGLGHARNPDGTAKWFASMGFRRAELLARGSGYGEIAMGLGLGVGLLTGIAAAGVVATMFTAFWAVHRFAGFFVYARPDEGYEYVATLALLAASIAVLGPGSISLDAVLGWDTALAGTTGLLLALGGLAAGGAQVAVLWRKPQSEVE
ncbi:MAG: DoxX family protein [Acidimicrobiia bacterium]|nr:DoxX family protein [Acidimicrobiia bacterium]